MPSRSPLNALAAFALGAAVLAVPATSASARPMAWESTVAADCVSREADKLKLADLQHAASRSVTKVVAPSVLDLVPRPRRQARVLLPT